MSKPTLLILAAGMGSRYGGLKQIDAMGPGGEAILDYSVYDALRAGFGRVVIVIRRDFESQFREFADAHFAQGAEVDYAFQQLDALPEGYEVPEGREKPWGTAHAILMADGAINEPFAVINADDFYGRDAYAKLAGHLTGDSLDPEGVECPCSMVGFLLKNTLSDFGTVSRGICDVDASGNLKSVEELTKIAKTESGAEHREGEDVRVLTGEETVSMNMWGFTPALFPVLREKFEHFLRERGNEPKSECYIPAVVDELISEKRAEAKVLQTSSPWFGVTYQEDKPLVMESIKQLITAGEYPESLWD
ncbi:MAG: nucleotidyltransferase [Verrucomicrobiota bacterium]